MARHTITLSDSLSDWLDSVTDNYQTKSWVVEQALKMYRDRDRDDIVTIPICTPSGDEITPQKLLEWAETQENLIEFLGVDAEQYEELLTFYRVREEVRKIRAK